MKIFLPNENLRKFPKFANWEIFQDFSNVHGREEVCEKLEIWWIYDLFNMFFKRKNFLHTKIFRYLTGFDYAIDMRLIDLVNFIIWKELYPCPKWLVESNLTFKLFKFGFVKESERDSVKTLEGTVFRKSPNTVST